MKHSWKFLGGALVALLAGCATLPDTRPFTTATVQLHDAVAAVDTSVAAVLTRAGLPDQSAAFDRSWQARTAAMTALVSYASSVQAIVDAGGKGEEAGGRLTDATKKLAQSVGWLSNGTSAGFDVAADAFRLASGVIAKARAARTLEKALAEMQPVIEEIAGKVVADFADARVIVQKAAELQRESFRNQHKATRDYRTQLLATKAGLESNLREQLAGDTPPSALKNRSELKSVDELLAERTKWSDDYAQVLKDIDSRGLKALALIDQSKATIAAWAAGHGQLLATVKTRRPPSTAELLSMVGRLNDLIDRYREL